MNKIYEKNMSALEKVSKRSTQYIKDKIKRYEQGLETKPRLNDENTFDEKGLFEEIEIETEVSYDNQKIFRVKKGQWELYLSGKRKASYVADIWSEGFENLPRTSPIFLFGIGDGAFLKEVSGKTSKDVRIFLYEPSLKIFIKCLEEVDLTEVFKKGNLTIGIDNNITYDEIKEFTDNMLGLDNLEFMRKYILPGYYQLYPEEAKKYMSLIREKIGSKITYQATKTFFSNISMGSLLYNAMYLPDCYTTLQLVNVIPRDIPAIVVAAGPSLNKNINELKKAKNKAFIIAADTAIKPLMRAGIVPDMFAVVDGVKPPELVNYPGVEKIPLLASIISSQAVLAWHEGKKFFFDEGYTYIRKPFNDLNCPFDTVTMGGSVATTAFALAYMIGIDNIILVGQDLALTGNKTHADGTFKEKMEEVDVSGYEMVEGNIEDKVPIRPDFRLYLDWYNYYINGCRKHRPSLRVINATEGGAKINETEVMTLRDAIDELCSKEVNVAERIESIKPVFEGEKRKKVVEYLNSTENGFLRIAEDAKRQKKLYQKIDNMANTGNIPVKEYSNLLNKLKKLNKSMAKSPLYGIVEDSLVDASLILQRELLVEEDSIVEEAKELARKGTIYMGLVEECAMLFKDVAANSVSHVK